MTFPRATRLLPALALSLLVSGCAFWRTPETKVAVAPPPTNQCVLSGGGLEGRLVGNVPYPSRQARCEAESWCAAAGVPQARDLVYSQVFARCMATAAVVPATPIGVGALGAAPAPAAPAAPAIAVRPPRPYRN